MNIPTTYEGILELAKLHGINLKRLCTTCNHPDCCVLSTIAYDNGITYTELVDYLSKEDELLYRKMRSIEWGFEYGADHNEDEKIGKKLYDYSRSQQ